MKEIRKSSKLANVCYDIRGPVLDEAQRLIDEGQRILKLNVGNTAPFGLNAPDEIITDVIRNLSAADGYSESKGIYSARKAVMQYYQQKRVANVDVEDIFLGNGVSELISMATHAILEPGDEVLIPSPDYPLWTASVTLAGGTPVHYICDEQQDWFPDVADIRSKITSKTKAIVIINPNNPTGAVYSDDVLMDLLAIAREHNLIVLADEIYDKVLYDGVTHTPLAAMSEDLLTLTFNGLSKAYRLPGFRSGWLMVSGPKYRAKDLLSGLNMLASMRLCANMPGQIAIQTALGGYQTINDLVLPTGRLGRQRKIAYDMIQDTPGLSTTLPKGAMYMFVKVDTKKFGIKNDEQMILDLLRQEKILLVHGRAFNWPDVDHFRMVYLPDPETLTTALTRMQNFFATYKQV